MKEKYTRIAAYGLVSNSGKMLLCRISKALPRWQGQWTLPGGGVDFGEHPENAAAREVMEETGISVRVVTVAAVDSICDDSGKHNFHGIRIIYHTDYLGGELRHEVDGTTDICGWFTEDEIRELALVDIAEIGVGLQFKREEPDTH